MEKLIDKNKKILILSCGTGGGHNSAARAIQEKLLEKEIKADFYEYLDIINPKVGKEINKLYLKYINKYDLYTTKLKIKAYLYNKGYTNIDIDEYLKKTS